VERRRVALIVGVILAVAFALRLGHVLVQRGDVLFDHPALDEDEYVFNARALAAGHGEDRPYWQPPGLVYAMAATMKVAGPGLLAPRLVQVVISVASCLLLFAVARRLFDVRAALAAMAIAAIHGVLVFECSELLPATWIVFFDLLALWLVLRAAETRRLRDAAAAGLVLGISILFTPTVAPFVVVAALLVRVPRAAAALVVAAVIPVVPVTVRNYQHGHELVLVSTNGGLNLYIGNNAHYADTFAIRPGVHWEALTGMPDQHGIHAPGATSTYFTHEVAAYALHHPLGELALLARKTFLFVHGAEIPRDTSVYDTGTPFVVVTPRPLDLPDGILLPAALLGIAALWRERRRLAAPLALLATIAASGIVFFVAARHRAPALPLFALFAAGGAAPLVAWMRRRPAMIGVAAALVIALNIPTWETSLSYAGEADFYRGVASVDSRDVAAARAWFTAATVANPRDPRAWFELANISPPDDAIAALRHAAADDPWDTRASRRLAQLLVARDDLAGAIDVLEASIAAHARDDAHYAPDHLNLAFMLAQQHELPRALAHFDAARRADPGYVEATAPRMLRVPGLDPAFVEAVR
jgi:hypothetical protein